MLEKGLCSETQVGWLPRIPQGTHTGPLWLLGGGQGGCGQAAAANAGEGLVQ
jgi:hypothetical protein